MPREANTTPVFQVVFAYQNVPAPEWTFPCLTVDAGNIHNGTAQFELTLVMWETDDGFRGSLEYDTDLFDPETISQFARSFGFVLEAVTQNPDQCLARVPLLSEDERRRIVEEFNQTAQEYPRDQTIHRFLRPRLNKRSKRRRSCLSMAQSPIGNSKPVPIELHVIWRMPGCSRERGLEFISSDRPSSS